MTRVFDDARKSHATILSQEFTIILLPCQNVDYHKSFIREDRMNTTRKQNKYIFIYIKAAQLIKIALFSN